MIKRFHFFREEDVSGVSGTGDHIASGVIWEDGMVALHWEGAHASVAVYKSISDCEWVHSHGGRTKIIFDDN